MTFRKKKNVNIKEERAKRGLSQQALAEATGIERAQLSRIEAGKVQPHAQTIHKIKNVFSDYRLNENNSCRVHDLCDDTITYYDNRYLSGKTNIVKTKVLSTRNDPEITVGDLAFFDADDIDLSKEGYFLFKFQVDTAIYFCSPDLRNPDQVFLTCKSFFIENLGAMKKSDLDTQGRLIHVGRNY